VHRSAQRRLVSGAAEQALLVGTGTGEIVQIGRWWNPRLPIYLVEFQTGHVVGCLEEEIAPRRAGHGLMAWAASMNLVA
jgi:hypothetical protein